MKKKFYTLLVCGALATSAAASDSGNTDIPNDAYGVVTEQSVTYDYDTNTVHYTFKVPNTVIIKDAEGNVTASYDVEGTSFTAAMVYRIPTNAADQEPRPENWESQAILLQTYTEGVTAGTEFTVDDNSVSPSAFYKYYVLLKYGVESVTTPLDAVEKITVWCKKPSIQIEHLAPVDVKAALSEDNKQIIVTWEAPELAQPSTLLGYKVDIDGELASYDLYQETTCTYDIPETVGKHTFSIVVTAVYTDNESVSAEAVTLDYSLVESLTIENGNMEVYDFNGMRVAYPTHGLYIIRHNGNVRKAYINK